MPISDEIIELEPVKKTKTKLIIMFAVTGVLLALAVTFLVLFLIKPSAVASTGGVLDVGISSSSELFSYNDGGERKNTASVGNAYTVYATISVEGNASPDIMWIIEPSKDAIEIVDQGRVTEKSAANADGDGLASGAPEYKYFLTFYPNSSYVNQSVTLRAQSTSSTAKSADIVFTIVNQGTEYIDVTRYRRGATGDYIAIDEPTSPSSPVEMTLPFSAAKDFRPDVPVKTNDTIGVNPIIYVEFSQYGMYDESTGEYSKITVDKDSTTNKVSVKAYAPDSEKSSDVLEIISADSTSRFSFRLKKPGDADIVISANVNNEYVDHPVSTRIRVHSVDGATLGLVEGVYFLKEPVTDEFFKAHISRSGETAPADSEVTTEFTLPNGRAMYDNISSHIVVMPYSIMYDYTVDGSGKVTGTIKSDWFGKVFSDSGFTSDRSDIVEITTVSGRPALITKKLSANKECTLMFKDVSKYSVGIYDRVYVNVVAPVSDVTLSLADESDKPVSTSGTVMSSQGAKYVLTVEYKITAPKDTDPASIMTDGLISNTFGFDLYKLPETSGGTATKSAFMTISQKGGTAITADGSYNKNSMTVTHVNGEEFKGVATFELEIKGTTAAPNGNYKLVYTKNGINYENTINSTEVDRLNGLDPDLTEEITFNLDAIATSAELIAESDCNSLLHEKDLNGSVTRVNDTRADIYIQNRSSGNIKDDVIDLMALIRGKSIDGDTVVLTKKPKSSINSTQTAMSYSLRSDYSTLVFANKTPDNPNSPSAVVKLTPINRLDKEITVGGTSLEFTFNIYLYNQISSIAHVGSIDLEQTVYAANVRFFNVLKDSITPTYVYTRQTGALDYDQTVLDLYYGNSESSKLTREPISGGYGYYIEQTGKPKTLLFEYTTNNNSIAQKTDLFEVGLDFGVDLSEITFKYTTIVEGLKYAQEEKTTTVVRRFVREISAAKLYAKESGAYKEITYGSNQYKYTINQAESGEIAISPVVTLADGTTVDCLTDPRTTSATRPAYITVPPTFAVNGDPYDGETNAYTAFRFTAPDTTNGATEKTISGLKVNYYNGNATGVVSRTFEIVVENKARPISNFGIYSDSGCSTSVAQIVYGKYNGSTDAPDAKTVYIQITYNAAEAGKYMYFEPVYLTLPSYLSIDGMKKDAIGRISVSPTTVTSDVTLASNPVETSNTVYTMACTIKLTAGTGNKSGMEATDKITVSRAASSSNTEVVSVVVNTGLKEVSVTDDGTTTVDTDSVKIKTFDLANTTDAQSFEIGYTLTPLSEDTSCPGITFDNRNLKITYSPSSVSGLSIDTTTAGKIIVRPNGTTTVGKTKLTFTFTDITNGGNTVIYTVSYNFVVTMDIFSISLAPETGKTFAFETTGESNFQTVNFTLTFNGGNNSLIPLDEFKQNVNVGIVTKTGGDVNAYQGSDVVVDTINALNGAYALKVSNTLYSGAQNYNIRVTYKGITVDVPITVVTQAIGVKLGVDTIGISGNEASIVVQKPDNTFTIGAKLYNLGTLVNLTSVPTGTSITYALYSDKTCDTLISSSTATATGNEIATIDGNGTFRFVKPTSANGVIYFRASYVDKSSSSTRYTDVVTVNYTVTVATVEISEVSVDGNGTHIGTDVFANDTFTLYMVSGKGYTVLDLSAYLKASTAFGIELSATPTFTVKSNNTDFFRIDSNKIIPIKLGGSSLSLTVSATLNGVPVHRDYNVSIVEIAAPTPNASSGTVNIVENETAEIIPTITAYSGLTASYTVSCDSALFTVADNAANTGKVISLKREAFTAADYKAHKVTVSVTYTASADNAATGSVTFDVVYTLTVEWKHSPAFTVGEYNKGTSVLVNTYSSENSSIPQITYDSNKDYYIVLSDDRGFTYGAKDVNSIVSVGAFENGKAKITIDETKFGTVELQVTAEVYNNSGYSSAKYTFVYGSVTAMDAVKISRDDGVTFTDLTDDEKENGVDISFGGATKVRQIRFYIDATSVGTTITADDVRILFSGDVEKVLVDGKLIQADATENVFYATFKVAKPTTFMVSGSIVVGGRTHYIDGYTLELTAVEPEFAVESNVSTKTDTGVGTSGDTLIPNQKATFAVGASAAGFIGSFEYVQGSCRIVAGGTDMTFAYDSVKNLFTLTPADNIKTDRRVTVGLTVKITDGALVGKTIYLEKTVTVYGVPLPELTFANGETRVEPGSSTGDLFSSNLALGTVTTGNGVYSYGSVTYSYALTAPSNYVLGTHYTVTSSVNGTYSINVLDNVDAVTRAGGRFTLVVTATTAGDINPGVIATSRAYDIIVVPSAKSVSGVSVSGKAGEYNIRNAVAFNTSADATQVQDGVKYNVVYTITGAKVNGVTASVSDGKVTVDGKTIEIVDGDNIKITGNVTYAVELELSASISVLDGAYAGETLSVDTTATVNGFKASDRTGTDAVKWNTGVGNGEYERVAVEYLLPSNVTAAGDVTDIAVEVLTNGIGAFITINRTNPANPALFFADDINVFAPGVTTENVEARLALAVTVAIDGGAVRYYYGESTIEIEPIEFNVVARSEGNIISDSDVLSISAGASVGVSLSETHGLEITGVNVSSELGNYLSCVCSGAELLFSAHNPVSEQNISVVVDYKVDGKGGSKTFNVRITPIVEEDIFSVSNKKATVVKSNADSYYTLKSAWISSGTDDNATGKSIVLSMNNIRNYIYAVYFTGFYYDGGTLKTATASAETSVLRPSSVTMDIEDHKYTRFELKFYFKRAATNSFSVRYEMEVGAFTVNYNIETVSGIGVDVTFDANGGGWSDGASQKLVSENISSAYTLPAEPIREGYSFGGWFERVDPLTDETAITTSTTVTLGYAHTLYAKWNSVPYTVELDYGFNASSTAPTSIDVEYGELFGTTLPTGSEMYMLRTGYTFIGWYTQENGGSLVDKYTDVTTAFKPAGGTNKTLYAKWTANVYDVLLDTQGGTLVKNGAAVASTVIKVTFGESYSALDGITAERTGYTFGGWYEGEDGGGAQIASPTGVVSSNVLSTEGKTLYAKWTAVEYTVTFVYGNDNANNDHVNEHVVIGMTYGQAYGNDGLPAALVKKGHTFEGWFTAQNGGIAVTDSTPIWFNGNAPMFNTVYARFTPTNYQITLDYGYKADPSDEQNITSQHTVTYNASTYGLPTLMRDNYGFDGWYTDPECTEYFVDGKVDVVPDDYVLYAKWIGNEYAITLNHNDGTGTLERHTVYFGDENYGLPTVDDMQREGYTFGGWYIDPDLYDEFDGTAQVTENVNGLILYAKWDKNDVIVSFKNGDDELSETVTVKYGDTYVYTETLPTVEKPGYTFTGWYTEDGKMAISADGEPTDLIVDRADSIVLEAGWVRKTHTLTLDADGGTVLGGSEFVITVTEGTTLSYATGIIATKEDCEFVGWKLEDAEDTEIITADDTTPINADTRLVAVWNTVEVEP